MPKGRTWLLTSISSLAWCLAQPCPAHADSRSFERAVSQDQASATEKLVSLAVQQGISSLPPTVGQGFQYEWDPVGDTFQRSDRLPPTSFRVPKTIGQRLFSLRVAGSYFGLSEKFGPVDYFFDTANLGEGYSRSGAEVRARVGILAFSATYGISADWEISANLPLTIVDAQARSIYLTDPTFDNSLRFQGTLERDEIDQELANGTLVLSEAALTDFGAHFSNGGVGLGRASILSKGTLFQNERLGVGFGGELFFPSPSRDELAGSDTFAILPRVIAALRLVESPPVNLHLDLGYEYDFGTGPLNRFVWSTGASVALPRTTFDLGFSGSKYDGALLWAVPEGRVDSPLTGEGVYRALEDLSLGDNFIDLLIGGKFQISDHFILSANVSVPLTEDGLRPTAAGTIALEYFL